MKIAFASCCSIGKQPDQPVWQYIMDKNPDLLLLLGDNVYMGRGDFNAARLEKKYKHQFQEPHFKRLIDNVDYLATWDDHDFGINNSYGAESPMKDHRKASRNLFHCYLKSKSLNPGRPQVYCSYTRGDVKIIMLDVRYYRQRPAPNSTLLGTTQELWLKRELKHNGRFTIICSGSCFSQGKDQAWINYDNWSATFREEIKKAPPSFFIR